MIDEASLMDTWNFSLNIQKKLKANIIGETKQLPSTYLMDIYVKNLWDENPKESEDDSKEG